MMKGKYHFIILILLLLLDRNTIAQVTEQSTKIKLAILRIGFEDFSAEEREQVNLAFFEQLSKDDRISVITEAQARNRLIPLGIEPYEISDVTGYVHAGQILNVDFIIVGKMDKIGDFVEVTFRVFSMPKGMQKQYPGGKTFDILINEEIPKIVDMIFNDMNLNKQPKLIDAEHKSIQKTSKKRPWFWISVGGAATTGIIAAIILSSKDNEGGNEESQQGLPRPPIAP